VEQAAAAADSMQEQARALAQSVAVFKVGGEYAMQPIAARPAPTTMRAPAKVMKASLAAPVRHGVKAVVPAKPANVTADDGWEEF
jgi:delta-aminolevulinic acid dehydratase/porphobilinogen synthase